MVDKYETVHVIGTIDLDLYHCISKDIVNDKVIITDKQFSHTKVKHPEMQKIDLATIKLVLSQPDYIIRDAKNDDTGLIIKKIEDSSNENLIVVLKVITNKTSELYNSVISSWIISDKRLVNYLKNREILYNANTK